MNTRRNTQPRSPRVAKLLQLQWQLLGEALKGDPIWRFCGDESLRVARSRAIGRLVARGLVSKRKDRYRLVPEAIPKLVHAAHCAEEREEAGAAFLFLWELERYRRRLAHTQAKAAKRDARQRGFDGAVASAVMLLARDGKDVNVQSVANFLHGGRGFNENTIRESLAYLRSNHLL